MKMMFRKCLLLLLGITWVVNLAGQEFYGKAKDIQQILEATQAFSQHYMDGEIAALAACYTDDGKIFPGGSDIIEGTEAIEQRWLLPEGVKILLHKVTPSEIRVVKKIAYDYGYYEGITRTKDNKEVPFKGKYVIVWKKVDGSWKIYLDIWNGI